MLICVKCYNNGYLSKCYNFACAYCNNTKYFFREEKIMSNANGDSINVPQGNIVSSDVIIQIGLRLQKTYQPPKKRASQSAEEYQNNVVQASDFPIVVELALARGHNPLSNTFHYWKQDGKITVDDHYAPIMNWAQSKQPFTYETQVLGNESKLALEGIEPGDYVVRFTAMKRADQPARQAYFKTVLDAALAVGKSFDEALKLANDNADSKFATVAYGVVKYNELHYKSGNEWILNVYATPKGWIPGVTRAEVRAIRNGIKKLVGMPMPEERRRLGLDIDLHQVAQISASMPLQIASEGADVRDRYIRLEDQRRGLQSTLEDLPEGEAHTIVEQSRELLRGKVEDGEFEDPFPRQILEVPEDLVLEMPADATVPEDLGKFSIKEKDLSIKEDSDAVEYNERTISLENAIEVALRSGYKSTQAIDYAIRSLFGKQAIGDLNELELWNFSQYVLRRAIVYNTNLPIDVRLESVPEIALAVSKPKTVKDAGAFIHNLLKTTTSSGKRMQRLVEQKVEAL